MIYFIADTHFYHANIIQYCNRPFDDVKEMNETMIQKWNSVVEDSDTVYHLGDVALCSNELLEGIITQLKGKKILIRGNHDTRSVTAFENVGFTVLRNPPVLLDRHRISLSHVPLPDSALPEGYINVHGHIHDKPLNQIVDKEGKIDNYPKELYSPKKHICVSVDVTQFRPISLDEIKLKMK